MYWFFVSFSVLFVCKCVLNYCHRVATKLQLNISYIRIKKCLCTVAAGFHENRESIRSYFFDVSFRCVITYSENSIEIRSAVTVWLASIKVGENFVVSQKKGPQNPPDFLSPPWITRPFDWDKGNQIPDVETQQQLNIWHQPENAFRSAWDFFHSTIMYIKSLAFVKRTVPDITNIAKSYELRLRTFCRRTKGNGNTMCRSVLCSNKKGLKVRLQSLWRW
jgi:hypothetical protein